MYYEKRISNCKICEDEYLQTAARFTICSDQECKTKNRALNKKIYDKRLRSGEKIIRGCIMKVTDTSMPEVRRNNIFILGQLNTCNTELVKLSLS